MAAQAHEFWIDPVDFTVAPGGRIDADLRVGQMFEGSALVYLSQRFRRFETGRGGATDPVAGRAGDRPALSVPAGAEGLVTLIHVTTDSNLTYREFAKFRAFVEEKDAAWTLAAHGERGLPETEFVEVYSRYAKALVAVGAGGGSDAEYGLETEIVALENPYTGDLSDGFDVRLLYRGAPRADAQIEVFEKDESGAVTVATLRTDADGRATVPVAAGRRYMLDAVVLREPDAALADATGAVWESLWANLTFAAPAK